MLGLYLLPLIRLIIVSIALLDDRTATGFTFLLYGYLIGWNMCLWETIRKNRKVFLLIAIATYIGILFSYFIVWMNPALKDMWWAKWLVLVALFNAWSGVLALLGFAAVYLIKPSAKLSYLNDAVLPYYILHQTFIVVLAFVLSPIQLGPVFEPLIIIVGTFTGCIMSYEIIRRVTLLRPLFGLKWHSEKSVTPTTPPMFSYRVRSALA